MVDYAISHIIKTQLAILDHFSIKTCHTTYQYISTRDHLQSGADFSSKSIKPSNGIEYLHHKYC